jgi:hypothetical protein
VIQFNRVHFNSRPPPPSLLLHLLLAYLCPHLSSTTLFLCSPAFSRYHQRFFCWPLFSTALHLCTFAPLLLCSDAPSFSCLLVLAPFFTRQLDIRSFTLFLLACAAAGSLQCDLPGCKLFCFGLSSPACHCGAHPAKGPAPHRDSIPKISGLPNTGRWRCRQHQAAPSSFDRHIPSAHAAQTLPSVAKPCSNCRYWKK